MGLGQYNSLGEYCGPHTASSVFLILLPPYVSSVQVFCHEVRNTVKAAKGQSLQHPGGGGGSVKMPGCVCWGSENVPILKYVLVKKNIPILKGSSAYFIPILWCRKA